MARGQETKEQEMHLIFMCGPNGGPENVNNPPIQTPLHSGGRQGAKADTFQAYQFANCWSEEPIFWQGDGSLTDCFYGVK